MSHNSALKLAIKQLESDVKAAITRDELLSAVAKLNVFNGKLDFDHTKSWVVSVICFALSAYFGWVVYSHSISQSLWVPIVLAGVTFLVGAFILGNILVNNSQITGTSDAVRKKNILLANNLAVLEIDPKGYYKELKSKFKEFKRGNNKREIEYAIQGEMDCNGKTIPFIAYKFHYVVKSTHTRSVSDGRGGTRTETYNTYHSYYRYGVILDFNLLSGIAVISDSTNHSGERYKPASNEFNKQYDTYAETELSMAKFLKPAVVLLFEDMAKEFSEFNFEVNTAGKLCVSFEDDDLIFANSKISLREFDVFMAELRGENIPVKLGKLTSFLNNIYRLSDANF